MPRLSALYVYPVKSCRGIALDVAVLDQRGIVHDREFLIVDAENRAMTQRATPAMAHILTALTDDSLRLQFDGSDEIRIPWSAPDRAPREVTIWRDTVIAEDTGDEAAAWLSEVLGQACRLVAMGQDSRRDVPAARMPEAYRAKLDQPVPVAFSDAFPLLVLSEESVADLNRRIGASEPLPMDRFRPNLVLSGCPAPYAEDEWKSYRVGEVRLFSAGPCGRCAITTTDQQTLARSPEPLRTLAQYRRSADGQVVFGQNVIHAQPGARLRVGDAVEPEPERRLVQLSAQ